MVKTGSYSSSSGFAALTPLFIGLLGENLEVEEPRLQPGHHEGGDGQHVAKGILGEELRRHRNCVILELQSGKSTTNTVVEGSGNAAFCVTLFFHW